MPTEVSSEDFAVAMSGPAVATNRYIGTVNGNVVRIAFLEQAVGTPSYFRAAIAINQTDIPALIDLLSAYLPQAEAATDGKE